MIKVITVGHNLQIGKSCARPNQNGIASATKDELRCDFTNKCSRNERMELVVQTFDDCGLDGKLAMNRVAQKKLLVKMRWDGLSRRSRRRPQRANCRHWPFHFWTRRLVATWIPFKRAENCIFEIKLAFRCSIKHGPHKFVITDRQREDPHGETFPNLDICVVYRLFGIFNNKISQFELMKRRRRIYCLARRISCATRRLPPPALPEETRPTT
jgi:hypothetical protein